MTFTPTLGARMPAADAARPDAALPGIVGTSPAMREVYRLTRLVAPTRPACLIVGETGTGKELIARAVHQLSAAGRRPVRPRQLRRLAESLLESELFGHVKGAFTGAIDNKTGRFEAAHGGTIFLDEISSMSAEAPGQAAARAAGERSSSGSARAAPSASTSGVVAATNQLLEDEIEAGRFRDDLYYRLNVVPIYLPPLRERREDIPRWRGFFLKRHAERAPPRRAGADRRGARRCCWRTTGRATSANWRTTWSGRSCWPTAAPLTPELLAPPGRRRAAAGGAGRARRRRPAGADPAGGAAGRRRPLPDGRRCTSASSAAVERELIEQVLQRCDGVQVKAAKRLGINRNTLHKKVTEYGASRVTRTPALPRENHPSGERPASAGWSRAADQPADAAVPPRPPGKTLAKAGIG